MSASSILSSPVLVVLLVIALQLLVHTYMASTQHGELCSRLHQIEEKLAALLEGSRDTRYSGSWSSGCDASGPAPSHGTTLEADSGREYAPLRDGLHSKEGHEAGYLGEKDEEAPSAFHDTNTMHFMFGLWDDSGMPDAFKGTIEKWRKVNPAWSAKLWTKSDLKKLWKEHFPQYIDVWRKALPIQRADIGRLMIVYVHGGLYADLDCIPSKPIDEVFDDSGFRYVSHDAVVCLEDDKKPEDMLATARWPIRQGVAEYHRRVANYIMWAKPGAQLIQDAIALAVHRVENTPEMYYHPGNIPSLNNPYAIIYTTGPDVMTEAVFPVKQNRMQDARVHVIGEGKCFMTNRATGTWIGDNHPAWQK